MFEDWYLTELISKKIQDTWKYTDHYLLKLIYNVIENTGILDLLKQEKSIHEIISVKSYSENSFSSIKWILDRLAMDGYLSVQNEAYKVTDKKMEINLTEIINIVEKKAPDSIPTYDMLKLMSDFYPDFLAGKKTGVDIIFSPEYIKITYNYYRNDLYYNVHNICGAKILNYDLEKRIDPSIIEIGGGLGGGTIQFLKQRLENNNLHNFKYYFTDIANKMLRSTKKEMLTITEDLESFYFDKLDFNQPLQSQGYDENSYDVIWGVNAVHVAKDLEFTLKEFYKILKSGGSLVISETVRSPGNKMIQQEFILNTLPDYWNVKIDKNYRPCYGFMEWRDWVKAIKSAGFKNVETIPDMSLLENKYDNCYISVIRGIK